MKDMSGKKLFILLTVLLYIIATLHILSLYFFWYWTFWWMDIILHTLGGIWVGGMFLWWYVFFFLKKHNIALPHLCPNCRHYQRLAQRNPMKLWHRQCMCEQEDHNHQGRCQVEFETSYDPEKKEIVYCESCYNREVI